MKINCTLLMLLMAFGSFSGTISAQMMMPPSTVLVEKAINKEQVVNKKYIGRVEAIQLVSLQPRVSGTLEVVNFKEGAFVKKGDLLFKIEDIRYRAGVQEAQGRLDQIKAKIKYVELTVERQKKLLATNAVSADTVDSTISELSSLMGQKLSAEAELVTAQDDLKHCEVVAPISGRIGRVTYTEGNYVTPAGKELATIVQTDPIYVRFPVSERDVISVYGSYKNMKANSRLNLCLSDGNVYDKEGVLTMMNNEVSSTTDTVNMWASFENKDEVLSPGGVVTVLSQKQSKEVYPSVLISAVMHDENAAYVYVLDDKNVVSRREVKLGSIANNRQIILDGITSGETVIIDGTHKASPGMTVIPVERELPASK